MIDVRVGLITKVAKHPNSDKLFCEEIDVGEAAPRQIVSGLQAFYTEEEMLNRKVLVVCNLKAAKLAGSLSEGMVLCAKGDGKVELISPHADSKPGDKIICEGVKTVNDAGDAYEPKTANLVKKKKLWESYAEKLKTDEKGQASFDGAILSTSAGQLLPSTVISSPIS